MSEILLNITRGDPEIAENIIRGDIAVVDSNRTLKAYVGDPYKFTFMRSCSKPLQASVMLLSGAFEQFGFTGSELAVMCASHNAEPFHVEAVLSILNKLGLDESYLKCGETYSYNNQSVTADFIRNGLPPKAVYNNCSGKHCAMLAACLARGYPLEGYYLPGHPLQKEIANIVAEYADLDIKHIGVGIDGCGVPVFAMPIFNMAYAYARLTSGKLPPMLIDPANHIVSAMTAYPFYVAGNGDFGSELMALSNGGLIAKMGADGVYCIGIIDHGLGIALKMEDGSLAHMGAVIMSVLEQIGFSTPQLAEGPSAFFNKANYNCRGEIVGRSIPVFSLQTDR